MLLVSFFLTRLTGCKAVNAALDANELSVAMHLEQQLIEGISVPSSGGGHNLKDVHFSGFCDAQGFPPPLRRAASTCRCSWRNDTRSPFPRCLGHGHARSRSLP